MSWRGAITPGQGTAKQPWESEDEYQQKRAEAVRQRKGRGKSTNADDWDVAGGEAGATKHNQVKRGAARAKKGGTKAPTVGDAFDKARLPYWQQNALQLEEEKAAARHANKGHGRGAAEEAADDGGAWATVGKDGRATMNSQQRRELKRAKLKLEKDRAAAAAAEEAAAAWGSGGSGGGGGGGGAAGGRSRPQYDSEPEEGGEGSSDDGEGAGNAKAGKGKGKGGGGGVVAKLVQSVLLLLLLLALLLLVGLAARYNGGQVLVADQLQLPDLLTSRGLALVTKGTPLEGLLPL